MRYILMLVSLLCCVFSAVLVNARDLTPREREAADAFTVVEQLQRTGQEEDKSVLQKKYLVVREQYPDTFCSGYASNAIGRLYLDQGDTTKALEYYQWTLDQFSDIPDSAFFEFSPVGYHYLEHVPYAVALGKMAEIYYELKDYASAKPLFQEMVDRNMTGGSGRILLREEDYLFLDPHVRNTNRSLRPGKKWATPNPLHPGRYNYLTGLDTIGRRMLYLIDEKYNY